MTSTRLFLWSFFAAYAWALMLSYAWQSGIITTITMPLLHLHESHKVQAASITLAIQKTPINALIIGDEVFQKRVKREGNIVRIMIPQMNLAQAQALLKASHAFSANQIIVQNRPEFWSNGILHGSQPNQTLWQIAQGKGYRFNPWPIEDIRLLFDLIGELATIPYKPITVSVSPYWINQEWKFSVKRKEYFAKPLANAERIIWIADETRQPIDNQYGLAEHFRSEMTQYKKIEGLGTFTAEKR